MLQIWKTCFFWVVTHCQGTFRLLEIKVNSLSYTLNPRLEFEAGFVWKWGTPNLKLDLTVDNSFCLNNPILMIIRLLDGWETLSSSLAPHLRGNT